MQQRIPEADYSACSIDDLLGHGRAGNLACVAEAFRRLQPHLLFIVTRILVLAEDREDAIQEGFLKVVRGLRHFDAGKNAGKAWICKIIGNHAKDMRRQHEGRRSVQLQDDLPIEGACEDTDPAILVADREELDLCSRQLAAQPSEVRQVLLLRFCEGKTFAKIAEELRLSIPTAFRRCAHGVACMRGSFLA